MKFIEKLPLNLQKEWYDVTMYHTKKPTKEVWKNFMKQWEISFKNNELFLGKMAKEISELDIKVYNEWHYWSRANYHYDKMISPLINEHNKKSKWSFSFRKPKYDNKINIWEQFKQEWDIGTDMSLKMFKEMGMMSNGMLHEWRISYKGDSPHIYGDIIDSECKLKPKVVLWEEFKGVWNLDFNNYNEYEYTEMMEELDAQCYISDYIRDLWYEYRTDCNYHSYDSYSVREQYEIWCEFSNRNL